MTKQSIFPLYAETLRGVAGAQVVETDGALLLGFDNVNREDVQNLKYPCRIEALVMVVCVSGEVSFSSHMNKYRLTAGQCFVSSASVFEFHSIGNSVFYTLALESKFLTSMNVDMRFMMSMMTQLRQNTSIANVSERNMNAIQYLFERLFAEYASVERSECMDMSLRHVLCSVVYRICESIMTVQELPTLGVKDRSSEYFDKLMALLSENFREQRNVEFYADKLHVSSKHLSRVVRAYTGKSVHQWIDEFVALEIKNLLKYSNLSIQQISLELHFPNPSFMGQYFKRITGMTPGEYKRS